MNAIDAHVHAFPDGLAARAIGALEAGCPWKAVGDGTIGGLLRSMDHAGVEISLVCAIATKPEQVEGILNWCRSIRSERIRPLPSVHPGTPDAPGWVRRIADEAFVGIKLHPMYQDFHLDDPRMDEVFAAAEQRGLLVTSHCGRDIAFPPDDDRASPARAARVVLRHPCLKLICTHLGGWRAWGEVEEHLVGRAVYLETSFSLEQLSPRRAADMIRRHGENRVMMGSDWPWTSQTDEVRNIRSLPLTEDAKRRILSANASDLLGIKT